MGDEKGVGAGHKFDPYPVSWLTRDVLLFANSIGCTVDELQLIYVRLELRVHIQVDNNG